MSALERWLESWLLTAGAAVAVGCAAVRTILLLLLAVAIMGAHVYLSEHVAGWR